MNHNSFCLNRCITNPTFINTCDHNSETFFVKMNFDIEILYHCLFVKKTFDLVKIPVFWPQLSAISQRSHHV